MRDFLTNPRTGRIALAAAVLAVGGAAGAGAVELTRPSVEMAPVRPVAIASLGQNSGLVTLKGRVAEVYGNKFVMDDGTGHALVDTGPRGEDGSLFRQGAVETVQGRYERGFVHATFLIDQAGTVTALAPPPPGHRGPPPPPPPGGPDQPPPPPPPGADAPPPHAPAAPTTK